MIKFISNMQKKVNDIQYIFVSSIIALLVQVVLQLLVSLWVDEVTKTYFMQESKGLILINIILLGPMIESVLLVLLIKLLKNKLHMVNKKNIFIVSTIIFSISHYYDLMYIFLVFPSCFVIIYSYLYYTPKKLSSFKVMLYVHIMINIYILLLSKV